MCTRTVDRRERIVFGEQIRSSSEYRSHSAHAPATVALVRTVPSSVPARACSNTSRSHASAVRLVKNPLAGRPRSVQARPILRCACRPSGSRYFAYQSHPSRFAQAGRRGR
jgi:hypothetical protein